MERVILGVFPENTNNNWWEIGSELVQLLAIESLDLGLSAVQKPKKLSLSTIPWEAGW